MGRAKSAQKYELILSSARKIFYEKGYNDASLEMIATDCGMSRQLIIYYFPSKAAIANALRDCIAKEIKSLTTKYMYKYFGGLDDLQVSTAVEIKLITMLYLRDEKAMRFQRETLFLSTDPNFFSLDMSFYEMHVERYHLKFDESIDELKMIASLAGIGGGVLLSNYSLGAIKCSEEALLDYSAAYLFRLMNIPKQRIDEINSMSNTIIDLMKFRFEPYFVVKR